MRLAGDGPRCRAAALRLPGVVGVGEERERTRVALNVRGVGDEPVRRAPEPLDLAEIADAALDRVRRRTTDVEYDVDLTTWWIVGESQLLERAVTNLLDNAAKWSPAGGTIRVRLAGGVLTVTDEGPGIAPEHLPHIFDRFYRAAESRTLPGSGLGLSIVRRAAERHGGTAEVSSTPGRGSTSRPGPTVRTATTSREGVHSATSIANRMRNVCTDRTGASSSAPSMPSRPSRPRARARRPRAISSGPTSRPSTAKTDR